MSGMLHTVAETALFIRQAAAIWSDEDRLAFVDFIAANPEAGDVIPGTGGIPKMRWRRQGSGKRGGVRVIYFHHDIGRPLYLLMVYAKAGQEDLSSDEKKRVRDLVAAIQQAWRRR